MNKFYFLLFVLTSVCFGQNEHMNWHFGNGVGLNFATGNPVPFSGSMISTQESCASVSDNSGNVLFYTNGLDVWNANNTLMPNGSGLLGNISAQCIAIPRPGNPDKYFIVSTDEVFANPSNGLMYSEVDLSMDNGNGDVTALKNIQLSALAGEWLTAVPHANCTDTWIITHGHSGSSVFMAFHVSASGIDPTPVTTDLGFIVDADKTVGIMKPDPTGSVIAMTRPFWDGIIDLIDFDRSTGIASGFTNIYTAGNGNKAYGLEFSRSGNRLYAGEFGIGKLFQFDLTASNIPASRTEIGDLSVPGEAGQLQIAPNNKIYVNYNVFPSGASFIGAINNPEIVGTGCGFVQNAVSFGPFTTSNGLPWHYNHLTTNSSLPELGSDTVLCSGTGIELNPQVSANGATFLWSDGSTDSTLTVSQSGTYWVTYQLGACPDKSDTVSVTIDTTSIAGAVTGISGCAPLTISYTATGNANISLWNWNFGNGSISNISAGNFTYNSAGSFPVVLSGASSFNCALSDSVIAIVDVYPNPVADFSFTPEIVNPDESVLLTDQSIGSVNSWIWLNGGNGLSNAPEFQVLPSQLFTPEITLIVSDTNGCSDTTSKSMTFLSEHLFYVPNAFTPGDDAINDLFNATDFYGCITDFIIYNRWGEQIWKRSYENQGWDGFYNGKKAESGVYTWQITTRLNGIVSQQHEGHVVLLD